jgi:tRNA threonylcarbamoyladenosine biosynthesis protein TsaE
MNMDALPDTFAAETSAPEQTEALGAALARGLRGRELIVLSGELGAGKTVFVRGVARGLDVPAGVRVTSPTYVLQHTYSGGRLTLYHIDAYRLGGAADFENSGLREFLDDAGGAVCIEWPERIADLPWPHDRIFVGIEHVDAQHRQITIRASRSHVRGLQNETTKWKTQEENHVSQIQAQQEQ